MIEEKFCHVCGDSMFIHFAGCGRDGCNCTERDPYPHAFAALSELLKEWRFKVRPEPIVSGITTINYQPLDTLDMLKRCPFCGGLPVWDEHEYDDTKVWFITCIECHATGPAMQIGDNVNQLVRGWNNRPGEESINISLGSERDINHDLRKKVKKLKKRLKGRCVCL